VLIGFGVTTTSVLYNFRDAREALLGFKDDQGDPFIEPAAITAAHTTGAPPLLVTCPPQMAGAFEELFNARVLFGTTNTLYRAARLVVDSRLTDANDWYLDYVGGLVRPFIHQIRKRPAFVSLTDPNASEHVFMQAEFLYGVESSGAVDYGLWAYSVKTTNS
jgi:Mu-like prophage major head subunit gpT